MPQIKNKQSGLMMNITDQASKTPGSYDSNYWDPVGFTAPDSPTTPVEPKPTVSYNPDGTRSLTSVDQYWKDNPMQSQADFNKQQETTKADFASRQQQAIDSINNMYVGILAKADQSGQDRLGSTNVINALSGQRGSASGAANVDKTTQANDEIYKGILAEKQNKINAIMSQTYKDQTEELRYQNDLRRKNLDSYLAYLGNKETQNLTKSKAMRAELIANNIKIEDIAPDTLKQMAENAGYTVDQFRSLYESERKTKEKEFLNNETKRLADLEKTQAETAKIKNDATKKVAPVTKTVGKDLYQFNDKTGLWDKVITAPKSSGSGGSNNEKKAIDEMTKAMSAVVGADGFISPQDHQTLRKQWVDSGLSATTFDTKFKGYMNPNNPNYVTNKKKTSNREL